jgi:hypothetical protein
MIVSQHPQQITAENLITYAKDTFVHYGVLWATPLVQFLERHCLGLGGVWARESVGRLLSPDSVWRHYALQLESYLENELFPETLDEMARDIWYRPGLHTCDQNATARLYWAAAFHRRGARESHVQYAMAIEVIVGGFPEGVDRFAVTLNEFQRLGLAALGGGTARA